MGQGDSPISFDPDVPERTVIPNEVDLFNSISFFIPSKFVDVLKYHMNQDTVGGEVERKFFDAFNIIIDHGTYAGQQMALITLGEAEQAWGKTVGSTSDFTIQWGAKFQMDDCDTYRCAFGPLVFIAHDFGEWVKIPVELARKLQVETEIEGKQCASTHFSAGLWYAANKQTRVPPSRDVVKQLARDIRLTEYNNACGILNQMGPSPTNSTGYELFSLRHDVCTGNHDRDYRGFYLFRERSSARVRVLPTSARCDIWAK